MNSRKMLMSAAVAVLMGLGLSAQAAERTRDAGEGELAVRKEVSLDGTGWRVWLDEKAPWENDAIYAPGEVPLLDKLPVNPPTGGWEALSSSTGIACLLPASIEEYFAKGINIYTYHGVSWFWRDVEVPAEWKGKVVSLDVEKARFRAEIYVNGKLAGYDLCPETPFSINLSDVLNYGKTNRLAIRLTNPGGQRGWADAPMIPWGNKSLPASHDSSAELDGDTVALKPAPAGNKFLPASHDFSGLGRLSIAIKPSVYVSDVFVKNLLPAGGRNIEVNALIINSTDTPVSRTISIAIPGTSARHQQTVQLPAGEMTVRIPLTVAEAKLWGVDSPNLYTCVVSLLGEKDKVVDLYNQKFGFRVFEVKEGQSGGHNFYLNGKRFVHRSAICWGYYSLTGFYATPEMAGKSVEAAKAMGQNGINHHRRIGEPLVTQLADEKGLVTWQEPGGFHMSENSFAGKIMEEKVVRMVKRDRNSPSLLIFSLSNEHNSWNSLREKMMRKVSSLDPTVLVINTSGDQYHNKDEAGMKMTPPGFVPHIRPYENSIRGDCHDPHSKVNDSPIHNEKAFFHVDLRNEFTDGPYYLGEIIAPTGPINWVKSYESRKTLKSGADGYDLNIYRENHDKLVKAFSEWRMDRFGSPAIKTAADISVQAGRGMMYKQGRNAQAVLCNNAADGFALNGWSSGPQSMGTAMDWDSAILDEDRNIKGPVEDFVYWTKPLQVAVVRMNGKYFTPGQTAQFGLWLVNQQCLPAGEAKVELTATDGAGRVIDFRKTIAVQIQGGDCFAQKLEEVSMPLSESCHGGHITLHAKLIRDGKEVAGGAEQVLLANRPSFAKDLSGIAVAAVNWPAAGKAVQDAQNSLVSADEAKVILAGSADENIAGLLERAKSGATLIIRFDAAWAKLLYEKGILSESVTEWGGNQSWGWAGNGWGYLTHFIGNQALPAGHTIGTTGWEIPANPVGFYPFASKYPLAVYGLYVARPWTAKMPPEESELKGHYMPTTVAVLLGVVDYGKGKVVLAPSYPVDANNAFNDLLFFNMINKASKNEW
jgi:hypothetical protein